MSAKMPCPNCGRLYEPEETDGGHVQCWRCDLVEMEDREAAGI